jgi:hypothetical protein
MYTCGTMIDLLCTVYLQMYNSANMLLSPPIIRTCGANFVCWPQVFVIHAIGMVLGEGILATFKNLQNIIANLNF